MQEENYDGYEDVQEKSVIKKEKINRSVVTDYNQLFKNEINRLKKEWQENNEDMTLIEYIEHYAPENICDEETFEIIYPNGLNKEKIL